jgi:hypothetical protein
MVKQKVNQEVDTMICLLKFRITNHVIHTPPLRKVELLTKSTPNRISFNHFLRSTNLLFSSEGEADLHKLFQDSPHAWEL